MSSALDTNDKLPELAAGVYDRLRHLADTILAHQRVTPTVQATMLVHDAYVRLAERHIDWQGPHHFYFAAARAMRDILVERARQRLGAKRGGGWERRPLEENASVIDATPLEVLDLHEALLELERLDPSKAQLAQLRYFAGLEMAEIAEVMGQSERTTHRQWKFIKAWLRSRLER
ncbi:MAG TPA: ECF-type sigma factor [Pirellulaceae bacterium]|nr:ECF-type sigma factor [Pirellulaceae bacterium]